MAKRIARGRPDAAARSDPAPETARPASCAARPARDPLRRPATAPRAQSCPRSNGPPPNASSRSTTMKPRAAIGQNVLELRAARGGVDRHGDGAEPGAAEHRQQQLQPVAAHDGDTVAGADAGSGKRCGIARRGGLRFRIGQLRPPTVTSRRAPWRFACRREHFWQRALGWREKPQSIRRPASDPAYAVRRFAIWRMVGLSNYRVAELY